MELNMLHNFSCVTQQVMVKELLFHFALQERTDSLFEIGWISLVNKEVKLVTIVVRKVSILLISTQSVPLFDEFKCTKLTVICTFDFSNLTQNFWYFN